MALIAPSAMDLPEIRHYLAELLTRSELAAAARVCKSWHKSFTPFLYREIRYASETVNPPVESIEAYAEYIREIHFMTEPRDFPLEALTKLESIVVLVKSEATKPATWTRLAALLRQNPELQKLRVHLNDNEEHLQDLMEALAMSCTKLYSLDISCYALDGTCTRLLLDTAVRLRTLVIDSELKPADTMDRWPLFANLEQVELKCLWGIPAEHQLEILRRSPQLKSLYWYIQADYNISRLPEIIAAHCPHLESLSLWGYDDPMGISPVLDSCRRLSKLDLPGIKFDAEAQRSLSRHYPHLTYLDVGGYCDTTSAMVQQVMVSCPRLDYFRAQKLEARDIVGVAIMDTVDTSEAGGSNGGQQATNQALHPQDWVCVGLRTLSLHICGLEAKPAEWHREVMRQLSRLTNLEELRIGDCSEFEPTWDGLDIKLRSGLDMLSNLKIREFRFVGLWQEMDEDDVRWMVEAWPKLSYVHGRLHHDLQRQQELQSILRERGIRVK
ncbi:hypothetical protein B0O80DRAFT_531436 [Mortierella sp. GBAus27b]|nr:hypothetical protein B0O80DRAFT_531436 [Mortierella sp. GBAus27b]